MNKTQHPTNNGALGAPKDWGQKDLSCGALPITRTEIGHLAAIKSYWKPTKKELIDLNNGAPVCLWVLSDKMAPVALSVEE